MTPYELLTKTIKPTYKVITKTWLDAETAKTHSDYPKSAWDKHPCFRLHVRINQSIDQNYIVSFIDKDYYYEEATITRKIIVKQKNLVVSTGDVVHMDPVTPFKRMQEVTFNSRLAEAVYKTKELNPKYGTLIENVVKFLRSLYHGTKANQHLFITLEFNIEEVYGCHEGVGDSW